MTYRCVCGRPYPNHLRDWAILLLLVIVLGTMLHAERERREYRSAKAELIQLGVEARYMLDSLRAYPR